MSEMTNDRSRASVARGLPATCASLAVIAGLILPQFDSLYITGYIASIVFAVATPLAFTMAVSGQLLKQSRKLRRLVIGTAVLAPLSIVGSALRLSLGSKEGAFYDIGAAPVWLFFTFGLFVVTLLATRAIPHENRILRDQ
ncbi:hypothetical protein AL755_03830 (plasmid) [Arthrobacter sp. ERGS1:01]|uniref:hypothetical protein n=1 Tax=Arthrobacter sp. ERGS1:01 TaxID=1704044 RepID=UPI0006B4A31D|nr:hypothetical protein [Arthrobacter sp. ERGS1:01]ALE04819.1 hypothetical protein AL755_03830 [Arthrobacter sp. ERGS1:01]